MRLPGVPIAWIALPLILLIGAIAGGCGTTDPGSSRDPSLGPPGDPDLAGWPTPRPWSPPFGVRARREGVARVLWRYQPKDAQLPENEVREAITHAMAEWERTGVIGFTEATKEETADITIGWRRGTHESCPPFLGWDGGLAHASDPSFGGAGFIHLNVDVRFVLESEPRGPDQDPPDPGPQGIALRRPETTDLRAVLLHELGHTLGLDHSFEPAAAMSELYRESSVHCTPPDAAGIHSLYGGGRDANADLWICSVDAEGVPHPVAPALRRVAPPAITRWDAIDVDGDGRDEIIVWPRVETHEQLAPLGAGLCVYHFGNAALLERAQGLGRGVIDPVRPLLVRESGAAGEPALLAQRVEGGAPRVVTFGTEGFPLAPVFSEEIEREVAGQNHPRWRVTPGDGPWPFTDLDGDGRQEVLTAGLPDSRGVRVFSWIHAGAANTGADTRQAILVTFEAFAAARADLDGDDFPELVIQFAP